MVNKSPPEDEFGFIVPATLFFLTSTSTYFSLTVSTFTRANNAGVTYTGVVNAGVN
jgi:hypothetical protein